MPEASLAAQCEARVGKTLRGKWTLEKLLGVGGMAAVYAGVHKIGRREAIKILHPELARSKELNLRFEQEARAVNEFTHPGAVEIRDIDVSEDGCPFLVMELLEGESLGERAERYGQIPTDDVLRYTDEVLDVLAAAHARGIIHRDIKLDNLFVTNDGAIKVLDFGIARMRSGQGITMVGARLGTTAYMSPEQVGGKDLDGRADIFAVGATMFRLITNRRIHEADNDIDLVRKMAMDPAPPLAGVVPGVDPGLALIVDRALRFNTADRYPNALTMQADIRALREGSAPPFASARAAAEPQSGPVSPPISVPQPHTPAPLSVALPATPAPVSVRQPQAASASAPAPVALPAPFVPVLAVHGRAPTYPPKGGGGALAILVLGVLVVGVALAGFFFVHRSSAADEESDETSADESSADSHAKKGKKKKKPKATVAATAAPAAAPASSAPAVDAPVEAAVPEPPPEAPAVMPGPANAPIGGPASTTKAPAAVTTSTAKTASTGAGFVPNPNLPSPGTTPTTTSTSRASSKKPPRR